MGKLCNVCDGTPTLFLGVDCKIIKSLPTGGHQETKKEGRGELGRGNPCKWGKRHLFVHCRKGEEKNEDFDQRKKGDSEKGNRGGGHVFVGTKGWPHGVGKGKGAKF